VSILKSGRIIVVMDVKCINDLMIQDVLVLENTERNMLGTWARLPRIAVIARILQ
jgi:hypothetical protein